MKKSLTLLSFALCISLIQSCKKQEETIISPNPEPRNYTSDEVYSWIDLALELTQETPGFTPPVAARVIGYSGLALYESVRFMDDNYLSMQGQIPGLDLETLPTPNASLEYHWGAVANACLATFLADCYITSSQENLDAIAALNLQNETIFKAEAASDVIDRSIEFGTAVAEAMLLYTNSDGQRECYLNNFPSSYVVPTGDGMWVPTGANNIPLQPYWGEVRAFFPENIAALNPIAPPTYSTDTSSAFYKEALEVYNTVQNLTPEQKVIAEYWSDDPGNTATPPGHSYSIMMQVLQKEQANLMLTAEVYAKLGMGLHDAFVSCWYTKYFYNLIRPISYIHDYIDGSWSIPLATPPFPEYTSGHSVQSGTTAKILTDQFGENYVFEDRTHEGRTDIDGSVRTYTSFYAFADEAAISRLYGGIHYRAAIEVGVDQGIKIGENIGKLQFKK